MVRTTTLFLFANILIISASCRKQETTQSRTGHLISDTLTVQRKMPDTVYIEKELQYDRYTLADTYPYRDTTRSFKWDKIRAGLKHLQEMERTRTRWGILQNYRNGNGESPLVKEYHRNVYERISDNYDVERFQSVALYALQDSVTPERYGRDGSLVKIINEGDSASKFMRIETLTFDGDWLVKKKYVKKIADTVTFNHAIFVDRRNENIVTLEKSGAKWLIRSMNPITTGLHNPPYQQETPLGIFAIQEKKYKMFFLVDGTTLNGGFAPYASRFCNGGYLHGIPVNAPRTELIEYSASLGTTPRSHMCVRNATSHAKFIYDNFPVDGTLVFVIE